MGVRWAPDRHHRAFRREKRHERVTREASLDTVGGVVGGRAGSGRPARGRRPEPVRDRQRPGGHQPQRQHVGHRGVRRQHSPVPGLRYRLLRAGAVPPAVGCGQGSQLHHERHAHEDRRDPARQRNRLLRQPRGGDLRRRRRRGRGRDLRRRRRPGRPAEQPRRPGRRSQRCLLRPHPDRRRGHVRQRDGRRDRRGRRSRRDPCPPVRPFHRQVRRQRGNDPCRRRRFHDHERGGPGGDHQRGPLQRRPDLRRDRHDGNGSDRRHGRGQRRGDRRCRCRGDPRGRGPLLAGHPPPRQPRGGKRDHAGPRRRGRGRARARADPARHRRRHVRRADV